MIFRVPPLVSKVFLWMAVVAFALFHRKPFLLYDAGWVIWENLWKMIGTSSEWILNTPLILSLVGVALLIFVGPFAGRVWGQSKMVWGLGLVTSGIATGYLLYYLWFFCDAFGVSFVAEFVRSPWFVLAPTLNFIGLLFARTGAPNIRGMPDPVSKCPD